MGKCCCTHGESITHRVRGYPTSFSFSYSKYHYFFLFFFSRHTLILTGFIFNLLFIFCVLLKVSLGLAHSFFSGEEIKHQANEMARHTQHI